MSLFKIYELIHKIKIKVDQIFLPKQIRAVKKNVVLKIINLNIFYFSKKNI